MESIHIQIEDLPTSVYPLIRMLRPSSTADGVAVLLFLLSALGYITRGRFWDKPDPYCYRYFERPQLLEGDISNTTKASRDISERLAERNSDVVIFWGSQSGTSERFAEALCRECHTRFGINALVADLSDYDSETIRLIPKTKFAIFILSTYGEGDPSDNTTGLWDWVKELKRKEDQNLLNNLRYIALGLGNSNYKYYNRVLDIVTDALDAAGATSLIPRQKADDAEGGTEEDYQTWKDDVFALFRGMGYEEKPIQYRPSIEVDFKQSEGVEPPSHTISVHHQQSAVNSPIMPLTIKNSRELFTAGDRNCMHLELDLGNHEVGYKTGDHIGIWPCNHEEEIEHLLDVLGLQYRRHEIFTIKVDDNAKPKVPSPTTLETMFRHHLEICGPVSRKTCVDLAQFAPFPEAKAMLLNVGQVRERYAQLTSSTHLTLARLLRLASANQPWTALPLSFVIEILLPLQPRYYSISSSCVISPRRIAITALVVNKTVSPDSTIHGLTSNYLLSITKLPSNALIHTPSFRHNTSNNVDGARIYAHIRRSKFKLPLTSSTPLILVAAGTGLAPFRAFLAERAKLYALGKPVGKMLLFFGCRHPKIDYIYSDELLKLQSSLGEMLEVVTAFSRLEEGQGSKKVYVQDRVKERGKEVLALFEQGASLYICGKAGMARDVDRVIERAKMKGEGGMGELEVKAWMDGVKKRGKWRTDVWG